MSMSCSKMTREDNINEYMKLREAHINSLKTIIECCGRCRGGGCCPPGGGPCPPYGPPQSQIPGHSGPCNFGPYGSIPPSFPGGGRGGNGCSSFAACGPKSYIQLGRNTYGPGTSCSLSPCPPRINMSKPAYPQACFMSVPCGPCGSYGSPGPCAMGSCGPCDPCGMYEPGPKLGNSPWGSPCLPLPLLCPPSPSANGIIEDSKRQMSVTEQEIRDKLKDIRNKKDRLESDISELQKTLMNKHRQASANLQAAHAAKAAEASQAAQVAQAVQAAQAAQACEAARAAAALQEAQCEQTFKAAQAAKAAEIAQCAQANQAAQYAQAAQAAQIAEAAQVAQALQAEEAARAADAVKAAQANQTEQAKKAFQAAEHLRQAQAIQACKAVQAIEAIHAAHVSQVAQETQACQAQCQAQTMLQCHKYLPNIACRQYPYCPSSSCGPCSMMPQCRPCNNSTSASYNLNCLSGGYGGPMNKWCQ